MVYGGLNDERAEAYAEREYLVYGIEMKRNPRIVLLRAVAIVLVTWGHVWGYVAQCGGQTIRLPFWTHFLCGATGVAIFVFITGYLAHNTISRLGQFGFVRRRLTRIYLPYVAAILFWNILNPASLGGNLAHLTFTHNLYPTSFLSVSPVLWFIGMYVQVCIIGAALWPWFTRWPLRVLILSIVVSVTLSIAWPGEHIRGFVVNRSALVYLPVFLVGVLVARHPVSNSVGDFGVHPPSALRL